jgi:hypothetical protein
MVRTDEDAPIRAQIFNDHSPILSEISEMFPKGRLTTNPARSLGAILGWPGSG